MTSWNNGVLVYCLGKERALYQFLFHTLFHHVQNQMSIELKEGSHIKDAQKKEKKEDCES